MRRDSLWSIGGANFPVFVVVYANWSTGNTFSPTFILFQTNKFLFNLILLLISELANILNCY